MFIVLIVFLQSALFAVFHLHIRKLEEKGVSAHMIAGIQRYTILPAVLLFVATYKSEYISLLLTEPQSLWWIAGIAFFWGIAQYANYLVLDSASSLSFVHVMGDFFGMPIILATAILINHDYPNPAILIAMALLVVGMIIKPAQHAHNKRRLLKYGIFIVIGLVVATHAGHALNSAFYKNILQLLGPKGVLFGISIYILVTSMILNIIYWLPIFKKPTPEEKSIIKKYRWTAYSIPIIWFVASLPEGYSFAKLPLFTLSALGAFSFLIKMVSDLKNKRILWNLRTVLFALVVVLSIVFSTLSLR